MPTKLELHFLSFVRRLRNAELIDELLLTPDQRSGKRADIFFNDRLVIGEVKSLETDTSDKIQPILQPYERTPEWPIFYADRPISKILEFLPDRESIQRRIYDAIAGSLEYLVRDANRQIRDTKRSFEVPAARGLLVVLNDTIDILDPNVMAHKFGQTLLKKDGSGQGRYPHVEYVWLLSATHTTAINGTKALLSLAIPNPRLPEDSNLNRFMSSLQQAWATFNGMPMFETTMPIEDLAKLGLRAAPKSPEPTEITRSELWRREYRSHPNLRSLTREELLDLGNVMMDKAARLFAHDGPELTEEQMHQFGKESTAFFEEIEYRNMDMRELSAHAARRRPADGGD